jgi:hypothetical protein
MLLVIFGAGASYDSMATMPVRAGGEFRPPLAAQLFDDRDVFRTVEQHYPEAARIFPPLREAARGAGIEAAVEEYQAEADGYPPRRIHLASLRYYIREAIDVVSQTWLSQRPVTQLNYYTLLDQIDSVRGDSRVLMVSFNYDTLVEASLAKFGSPIEHMHEYAEGLEWSLFKVHGSVDWSRQVTLAQTVRIRQGDLTNGVIDEAALIRNAENWQEGDEFIRAVTRFTGGNYYVPAIAVPVQTKSSFQCPEGHLDVLRRALPTVTHILTIGWRAQEQHFMRLLVDHLVQPISLFSVSGSAEFSGHTLDAIRAHSVPIASAHAADFGFSELVSRKAALDFLRSAHQSP